jgi:hypothetical protein
MSFAYPTTFPDTDAKVGDVVQQVPTDPTAPQTIKEMVREGAVIPVLYRGRVRYMPEWMLNS